VAAARARKVDAGRKPEPVDDGLQGAGGEQVVDAAVGVGRALGQQLPALAVDLARQGHGQVGGRATDRGVEHVGGDRAAAAHRKSWWPKLSRRSRVIWCCWAAAIRSSVSGSLSSRASGSASICAAVLPVAQTMKMWPKRCS